MFTIDKYIVADNLQQAYELNQNRRNVIIGGMLWLKMGRKKIGTAIDLSSLGLNNIEEDEDNFKIGCMCTLRDIELHRGLNDCYPNLISKSVEHIVGVQLRNMATIGGSIYSRFGFSDVLTAFLSLDSYVELYKGGIVSMEEYAQMPLDNDILIRIVIKKDSRKTCYNSYRTSSSDLPVLTCSVSNIDNTWNVVLGARPQKPVITKINANSNPTDEEFNQIISQAINNSSFGTNYRGSKEYREILAHALIKRNLEAIISGGNYAN
ncbi:CO/xanthine dehydrogenase FAD-binding subunit [Sedimentibacter acidaminivorans]|uniref:CO/xanthine dehydrogenase FAD-binding subunit n=1 Tax=Sedimentibacter acidaminivorans TaxID=913099 RepID=A0ABS4GEB1_9FIRM|nr:FAD binding domain-containing protein [Sedimentibacter acidaminivorans]MBP1925989.1 CO/xanthine dehydrogenase FAD-binding subunit [Sedimentibacter acidaminivorans]